ncbi:putative intron-binding protein aquarius [Plasmopara halstedii]
MSEASDDERTIICLQDLDRIGFLNKALWPLAEAVINMHYHMKKAWLVSVLLLVGFRARKVDVLSADDNIHGVWSFLTKDDAAWKTFTTIIWTTLAETSKDIRWTFKERTALTQFVITSFQSLEVPQVATFVLQMTSISIWTTLSPTQRALEFQMYPKLERHWNRVMGQESPEVKRKIKKQRQGESTNETLQNEQKILICQLNAFFEALKAPMDNNVPTHEIVEHLRFIAAFLALLIDFLSQLSTRRFLLTILRRRHIRTLLKNSAVLQYALEAQDVYDRQALIKQITLLDVYMRFPVDAQTGASLSPQEQRMHQTRHIQKLQQYAFLSFRNSRLEDLAVAPCGHIADALTFEKMLYSIAAADRPRLSLLAIAVGVLADQIEANSTSDSELIQFFTEEYSISSSDMDCVFASIYPTEIDIWSEMLDRKDISSQNGMDGDNSMKRLNQIYSADETSLFPVLPVRRLGLQYLNLKDYFQRNFELLRFEVSLDVRKDLETVVKQLDAVRTLQSLNDNDTIFRGFSPSAVALTSPLQIVQVRKPSLGQTIPAAVVAQVEVELSSRHDRKCFDCYQRKEVVFLVTLRATADELAETMAFKQNVEESGSFPEKFGVLYVRAGKILEVQDVAGNVINAEHSVGKGRKRVFKLALDGLQYKKDIEANRVDAYQKVNILVRRIPLKNNLRCVFDTVAGACINADSENLVPSWLHDLFLGYGDPATAFYMSIYKSRAENQLVIPLFELLQNGEHALDAGDVEKLVHINDETVELKPNDAVAPFTYVHSLHNGANYIQAYDREYPPAASQRISTSLRYTKAQVAAVRSGQCEGLTLVVGPPGTGKTTVAVQLVMNLYRTSPEREKILVVAHSNQALNDFFAKVLAQNVIPESEIVRIGREQFEDGHYASKVCDGNSYANFSRSGRVAFLLKRRAELLTEVEQMAQWLMKRDPTRYAGLADGSASYSCENTQIFYQFHMKQYIDAACEASELPSKSDNTTSLMEFYTLQKGAAPDTIVALHQFALDIKSHFHELRRLQPFELLHTSRQRDDMYMIDHARIVVMTCTHSASDYHELTKLNMTFGSLIMEDAAQISEVNMIVPLLLACSNPVRSAASDQKMLSGLKRVVLLGDPKQLPPVVRSIALRSYAHFGQSLFSRFLRLGVPHIMLDYQGRCRSELVDIYQWRYENMSSNGKKVTLGDLPHVKSGQEYQTGNTGFAHVAQFIDLSGVSIEHQLKPHAYENMEEAKFIVALFWYMMGIGYRPDQVTILTTYTAQKDLLKRLLCVDVPKGAKICSVSTIDSFQGKQNDYILLSTVRSGPSVGRLEDVCRASTAFSRARLGLYVVGCHANLEQSCVLQPFLSRLVSVAKKYDSDKATKLALVPSDRVGMAPRKFEEKSSTKVNDVVYVTDRQQLESIVAGLHS